MPRDHASPFARVGGETVGWGRFLAEARILADRLPDGDTVINACADRYLFCLALVACLLRGRVTLLPPDRGARHLAALAAEYPGILNLADDPPASAPATFRVRRPAAGRLADGDPPEWPEDGAAVVAFSSGTTGAPVAHPKPWRTLRESARLIDAHLGGARGLTLVATVPPQHMYGLELGILLPLCRGAILHPGRPFFPADIAQALAGAPEPRALVTTPIHLRALVNSGLSLPRLAWVVSATAPLDPALARVCEQRFRAPLLEILGCTEAGSIAGRRPALDESWTLYDTITLEPSGQTHRVLAPHLPGAAPLHDRLVRLDARRFRLEGRAGDLINIAGKRASLASLDRVLLAIDGVEDGSFFLPASGSGAASSRLVAFVVAARPDRDGILARLRAELDPAFLPRAIHFVDALPRNDRAKLPREALESLLGQCRERDGADP